MNALPHHLSNEPLSKHFSLKDLCFTGLKVPNKPEDPEVIHRLRYLAETILEPVQAHFRRRIIVHSGFQSAELSKLLPGGIYRGNPHQLGQAVDFRVEGFSNWEVANWMANQLDFDELMLEHFVAGVANSGWIHCATGQFNRRVSFTDFRGSRQLTQGLWLMPPLSTHLSHNEAA